MIAGYRTQVRLKKKIKNLSPVRYEINKKPPRERDQKKKVQYRSHDTTPSHVARLSEKSLATRLISCV